jgi:sporulation protein YlmC with PRC-barrel domain
MLKKLMVTTALTGLMIGAAVAEGTPPAPSSPSPPAAQSSPPAQAPEMTSPAPSSSTAAKPEAAKPEAAAKPAASSAKFVNSQRSDQFLASKFKGTDVVGNDNQKIGDVSDILFDKEGKIEAYVIGVGGFLGIGAKDVALAPSTFQVVPGDKSKNESDKLKLSMTKDELKQAATFEPYKAPSSTTGMGGAGAPPRAPAGGGMAR